MKNINFLTISFLFFVFCFNRSYANEKIKTLNKNAVVINNDTLKSSKKNTAKTNFAVTPPIIKASGDQFYCPQTTINIVTSIEIKHDPLELGTKAGYIQISSGYSSGLDKLELTNIGAHSTILTSCDPVAGK